ncbi:radical SAM/SPASM domain-containing protein [Acetivibrio cellulolyticus]|uniref:radical SAM/SPASM domain-containing protein n=1 Tax=Acetivibrio cellulolyticus TaxID=35830 RepID=UPI0001E2D495|nr:radical SAM protein [Acetivibrio cellulolyticus]
MILAKNNIIVKIQNSKTPEYAILNPVSGNFDLMDQHDYNLYQKINEGGNPDNKFSSYLLERGYAFKKKDELNASIDKAYEEFKNEIGQSHIQLMLVPTYGCNLACTYCFQHGLKEGPSLISKETVDAFFEYAKANFSEAAVKPFITLFGGEPLVNSPAQKSITQYIIDKTAAEGYEFAAVTNGYDFMEYVDILKKVRIKEIQFTLDGSKEIHDTRRATANKKGTFDKIIQGIEAAVNNKIPVNLRSVVDMENIKDIVNLAEFLDKKGWLDLPPELFKTQIGRNYELFDCYAKPQHLMTQIQLWGEFASLSKSNPILAKFHRPDFKGIRHLVDTGELYMSSFDTCPACKTEWVFDLYGKIYGCTASCGREEYLLGTYWPQIELNIDAIKTWQTRDVKSISKCSDCKYDVICGGGCGVVAANQNDGNVHSPDCRPIYELLETGINYYIDNIRKMAIGNEREEPKIKVSCCTDTHRKHLTNGRNW